MGLHIGYKCKCQQNLTSLHLWGATLEVVLLVLLCCISVICLKNHLARDRTTRIEQQRLNCMTDERMFTRYRKWLASLGSRPKPSDSESLRVGCRRPRCG